LRLYLADEIYTAWPFYGSRRIHEQLGREGQVVNRKAVQRHMQEMGLIALGPRPVTSRRNPEQAVYPYLLRHVRSGWPNHIWGAAGPIISGALTLPH